MKNKLKCLFQAKKLNGYAYVYYGIDFATLCDFPGILKCHDNVLSLVFHFTNVYHVEQLYT